MSAKPIIAVDIDEVLAQFIPTLAKFHNEVYGGVELTAASFISYEFHHVWGGTKEECSDKMDRFFQSTHFREHVEAMPRAYDNLIALLNDYELHIVTARQHVVEDLTRAWINKHFPNIFTDIHFGNHYSKSGKSRSKAQMCKEIGAVMLIDDSLSYATQVSREGIHVLLFGDYAWNQVQPTNNRGENVEIIFSPHTKDEVVIHDYSDALFESDHQLGAYSRGRRVVYRVHDWDTAQQAVRRILDRSSGTIPLQTSGMCSSLFDLKIAVIQMCSVNDKAQNLKMIGELLAKARHDAIEGLDLVCLPEGCVFMGNTADETIGQAETITKDSQTVQALADLAKLHHVFLSVGGFPEKRTACDEQLMMSNCHFIINPEGEIVRPQHRKVHLFDCPSLNLMESKSTISGNEIAVIEINGWKLGLSICYDVRFPGLYQAMKNIDIILVPSAFTVPTGSAHWEILLRARAIENQCYVIAAAQSGKHNDKRISYGHSMVVDPWGTIVNQLYEESKGYLITILKKSMVVDVRTRMPVLEHQRPEVYNQL